MSFKTFFNRYLNIILTCVILSLLLSGCNNTKNPSAEKKQATNDVKLVPNPLYNFWENYNFNDSTTIQDPNQSEQRLVNFIAAFPQYPISQVKDAIHNMLQKSERNSTVFVYFRDKYTHYLYNPNSPIRNESYYEPVLEYLIKSPASIDIEKIRYKIQLDMIRKNQPGSTVADFQYLTSTGQKENLHNNKHIAKLIIFYDPSCPHCKEIMNTLKRSELLNTLIEARQLQIIAIDPMGDQNLWKDYQTHISPNWINGFDHKDILIKKGLYNIAAYPTLYLIDKMNKVVLKDPDYQYLLNFLNQRTH